MSKASPLERLMLDLVNRERAEAGLDPLRLELRLNDSAEDHSAWMLRQDVFNHTGRGGSNAGERMEDAGFAFEGRWTWGENIALQSERGAWGLADDVHDLHEGLMNSPGHRANILNPAFEVLGIGIERGDYRGFDAVVVTQNFARTAAPLKIDGGASDPEPRPEPRPEPQPDPPVAENDAPTVEVDDYAMAPGKYHRLVKRVDYDDADGDRAVRFEIDGPRDGGRVRIEGRDVDAADGHVFDADGLRTLTIQFDASGEDQTYRLRAHDGEDWGAWDAFTISAKGGDAERKPEPEPEGDVLSVAVDDIVLKVGERMRLADAMEVVTDGDPLHAAQIVDADGGPALWMARKGGIDASDGAWMGVNGLDRLYVEADDRASVREMRIQVADGEDRSAWETFTVTTEWDGA